jgi:hypothetical protein
MEHKELYGVLARFANPTDLTRAARAVHESGYRKTDAYSPYPIEEVIEALHIKSKLPYLIFCGGVTGLILGMGLEYITAVDWYPIIVGGRPMFSWPAFIPVAYECTILASAFTAVFGMALLNGLPQPYHPVFNVKSFAEHASVDGFFLAIEAADPKFNHAEARALLESLNPIEVSDVEE